jgi:hypothetical protein
MPGFEILSTSRAPGGSERLCEQGEHENAVELTSNNSESHSKVIVDKHLHDEKAPSAMTTTCLGTGTAVTDEPQNACDSIRFNEQSDSKMISESESQYEKHPDPRISTCFGIEIDLIDK